MQTQIMDLRTWGGGRVSWDEVREWHGHIYTTKCKIDSQWEAAAQHREIRLVLCDHLEGWDREGRRETQERGDMGIYVYVQLIHYVIKQKLTHLCKAIILQKRCLKKKKETQRSSRRALQSLCFFFFFKKLMKLKKFSKLENRSEVIIQNAVQSERDRKCE